MGKPTICIGENKDTDQLRSDQRLCFRYMDSTINLLSKYKISSLNQSSVTVQPGVVSDLVGTQIVGCLMHRLSLNIRCR